MQLSVVVPVYKNTKNCVSAFPEIYSRLNKRFNSIEIIFIIDHPNSTAETDNLIKIADNYCNVHVYQLDRNYGQHFATLCGYYYSSGENIVSIDEDMFHYLESLDKIESPIKKDVLYVIYHKHKMHSTLFRKALSVMSKNIFQLWSDLKYPTTFRIIKRKVKTELMNQNRLYYNINLSLAGLPFSYDYFHLDEIKETHTISGYNFIAISRFLIQLFKEYFHNYSGIIMALLAGFAVFLTFHISWVFMLLVMFSVFMLNHLIYYFQRVYTKDAASKIASASRKLSGKPI